MRLPDSCLTAIGLPVVAIAAFDVALVRSGRRSISFHLGRMLRRHPWRSVAVGGYLLGHLLGDLLPANVRQRDLIAFVARRLEPRTTIVVQGNAPEERLRQLLEADKAETVRQIRAIRSAA